MGRHASACSLAVDPPYELRVREFKNGEFFVGGDTDRAEGEEFVVNNPNGGRLLPGERMPTK